MSNAAYDNNKKLKGFMSTLCSKAFQEAVDAGVKKFELELPHAISAYKVKELDAFWDIQSFCASPVHDYGYIVQTTENADGTPASTKVIIDPNGTYRSSTIQNVKPGQKAALFF